MMKQMTDTDMPLQDKTATHQEKNNRKTTVSNPESDKGKVVGIGSHLSSGNLKKGGKGRRSLSTRMKEMLGEAQKDAVEDTEMSVADESTTQTESLAN